MASRNQQAGAGYVVEQVASRNQQVGATYYREKATRSWLWRGATGSSMPSPACCYLLVGWIEELLSPWKWICTNRRTPKYAYAKITFEDKTGLC